MSQLRRHVLAASLAFAFLAGAAAAAAALDLDSILSQSSYSSAEREAIRAIFADADRMRIPREILLPRLAEGVAKRAPFRLAGEVLRDRLRSLDTARSILQSSPDGRALLQDEGAWSLSAALLENGAGGQEIITLGNAARGRAAAYRGAAFLHESLAGWGLSRQASLQVAVAALNSELPTGQYTGLISVFEQGRQMRISPERLARRVVESLPGAKDLDELRHAVLF